MISRNIQHQHHNHQQECGENNGQCTTATTATKVVDSTIKTIGGKKYSVKSVFLGHADKDVKTLLLGIAERRAMAEMGLGTDLAWGLAES